MATREKKRRVCTISMLKGNDGMQYTDEEMRAALNVMAHIYGCDYGDIVWDAVKHYRLPDDLVAGDFIEQYITKRREGQS